MILVVEASVVVLDSFVHNQRSCKLECFSIKKARCSFFSIVLSYHVVPFVYFIYKIIL